MDTSTIVNLILAVLSFILSAISVLGVIITLRQNKKILESNKLQIMEMRDEHKQSYQPIIAIEHEKIYIKRPQFFYSPPEELYSFQSIYECEVDLKNVSSETAVYIDVVATIEIANDSGNYTLKTVNRRINIIPPEKSATNITFSFCGDDASLLYEALRSDYAHKLPRIHIYAYYANTYGGYFKISKTYIIAPNNQDDSILKLWHSKLVSATTEYREQLNLLKELDERGENFVRNSLFDKVKESFDLSFGEIGQKRISLKSQELPESWHFIVLSEEEYNEAKSKFVYGHYIHKRAECIPPREVTHQ